MRDIFFEHVHVTTTARHPFICSNVGGTFVDLEPTPCSALKPAATSVSE